MWKLRPRPLQTPHDLLHPSRHLFIGKVIQQLDGLHSVSRLPPTRMKLTSSSSTTPSPTLPSISLSRACFSCMLLYRFAQSSCSSSSALRSATSKVTHLEILCAQTRIGFIVDGQIRSCRQGVRRHVRSDVSHGLSCRGYDTPPRVWSWTAAGLRMCLGICHNVVQQLQGRGGAVLLHQVLRCDLAISSPCSRVNAKLAWI